MISDALGRPFPSRRFSLSRALIALVCLALLAATRSLAAPDVALPPASIADIAGTPASIHTVRSRARVTATRQKAERAARDYAEKSKRRHAQNLAKQRAMKKYARVATPPRAVATVPRPKGAKPAAPTAPTKETLRYRFAGTSGEALTDAPVIAAVLEKGATAPRIVEAVTDGNGTVTLPKVGPFPVVIQWEIKNQPPPPGTALLELAGAQNIPDFALENAATSDLLPAPPSARVSRIAPHGRGVRVASVRGTFAAPPFEPEPFVLTKRVQARTNRVLIPLRSGVKAAFDGDRDNPVTAGANGVYVRYPVVGGETAPVSVYLTETLMGGVTEAICDCAPDPSQIATQTAPPPPMTLVRVTLPDTLPATSPARADFGDKQNTVKERFGEPGKKKVPGKIEKSPDGSEWWNYTEPGVSLKFRKAYCAMGMDMGAVDDNLKTPGSAFVERVRFTKRQPSAIARVNPGDPQAFVIAAIGEPESGATLPSGQSVARYLNNGLLVYYRNAVVEQVEISRPQALLQSGTIAFAETEQPKVLVEDFTGHPRLAMKNAETFTKYLREAGFAVVTSRAEANHVLRVRFEEPKSERGQVFTNAIPISYAATLSLTYDLLRKNDAGEWAEVQSGVPLTRRSSVDYSKELATITAATAAAQLIKSDTVRITALGVLALEVAELQRLIRRAASVGVGQAESFLLSKLTSEISRTMNFSARVTAVDYAASRLTVNLGTDKGVHAQTGSGEPATEFEIVLGQTALPGKNEAMSMDRCVARVISATPTQAVCELRRVKRSVSKMKERSSDDLAKSEILGLPDPASGVVSARFVVNVALRDVLDEE